MPERNPHPDNELIDALQDSATPSQQGRSGGQINRNIGTRAELERAAGEAGITRTTGSDNPRSDERKGDVTRAAIQRGRSGKG